MNQTTATQFEEQVQAELALKRVREEAASRETAGIRKTVNIVRIIAWCTPILGPFGLVLFVPGVLFALLGSIYILHKGDRAGGLRQLLISVLGSVAVVIVWVAIYAAILFMFS